MTAPIPDPRNHGEEVFNFMAGLTTDLADLQARRAALLAKLADASDAAAMGLLREAVLATGGAWVIPSPPGAEHWPPSHLAEVNVLGIWAAGRTVPELLDTWRKAARRAVERGA